MTYAADILADSISEHGGRLTTFEITLPRIMLSEFNTHRSLSRNSASSRAIPVSVSIRNVDEDPFIPEVFGSHQKGMVEGEPLSEDNQDLARHYWLGAAQAAVDYSAGLEQLNVYKGLANRLLEPFKWHTIIASGTDWSNFLALRTEKNAQAEIRKVAGMMRELYESNTPVTTFEGSWHTPLVSWSERRDADKTDVLAYWERMKSISIGRCARVSFMRQHDGGDPDADVARHDSLLKSRHLSPFEHAARPFTSDEWYEIETIQKYITGPFTNDEWVGTVEHDIPSLALSKNMFRNLEYAGNLRGWWSSRMDVPDQDDYGKVLASSPKE
jgi:thymidylate synthase ThyX